MHKIGYYIHHHGAGHRERALSIASQAPEKFVLLGTGLQGKTYNIPYIDLPNDIVSQQKREEPPLFGLHYAPLYHEGISQRVAMIAKWICDTKPALMVADVSVEVALLCRLCSIPYVYVRLSGTRDDLPHSIAFHNSAALLCPFDKSLEQDNTPQWIKRKSHYFSGLIAPIEKQPVEKQSLLFVLGAGGHNISPIQIQDIALQLSTWQIFVAGAINPSEIPTPKNLFILGWVHNIHHYIAKADIVAGTAGDGLITAVMAYNKPYICLPQERPFEEQKMKAQQLKKAQVAAVYTKWPENWQEAVKKASLYSKNLKNLHDAEGISKAVNFLINLSSTLKPSKAYSKDPIPS